MNSEKTCIKCQRLLPLSMFYKNKRMKDGHINRCSDCYKKDSKIYYSTNKTNTEWVEKINKDARVRARKKTNRKTDKISLANYRNRYPEKFIVYKLCREVELIDGLEKHHWSYSIEHALDFIPLTKAQHMKAHRFMVYDQERMMYRRCDNNELLDTREKHESYIFDCIANKED
jgi:hypothetical protein